MACLRTLATNPPVLRKLAAALVLPPLTDFVGRLASGITSGGIMSGPPDFMSIAVPPPPVGADQLLTEVSHPTSQDSQTSSGGSDSSDSLARTSASTGSVTSRTGSDSPSTGGKVYSVCTRDPDDPEDMVAHNAKVKCDTMKEDEVRE
eukprot:TRINITY_DN2138_c0_g1_i2.p1 TRINITY_DN2138_c0_g1~~TRINITY_DN2138_c0_g1_i2.p1  ORF type:complete len:148 (-),score=28.91 TRINITY_DN2138_c0_g1_i2:239-682(-)